MITPISILNFHKNIQLREASPTRKINCERTQDVFIPSFCGEDFQTQFDNELKQLDGIHCARCHHKTLSQDKYNNLMEQITQVKNGHELQQLLKDNKEYLSTSNSLILKDLENINKKHPNANIKRVLTKISQHSKEFYIEAWKKNINRLELVTEKINMPEEDKKAYKKALNDLKFLEENNSYKLKDFTIIMNNTLKESNYPNKRKLFDTAMREQIRTHKYYKSFSQNDITNPETSQALRNLGSALFENNISRVRNITNENKYKIKNKIILCDECFNKTRNNARYYMKIDSDSELKDNFVQYVQDLSRAIKREELHVNKNYINSLIKHVELSSNNRITLKQSDLDFLTYRTRVSEMPFENQEGIPCPKCSGIMLTHHQIKQISKRIKESDTIKELTEIIKENRNSFPPTTKKFAEKFLDTYIRDPYITDALMKNEMQAFTRSLVQKETYNFINKLSIKINDPETSEEIKPNIKKLRDNMYKYNRRNKYFYQTAELKKLMETSGLQNNEKSPWFEQEANDFITNIGILQAPSFHSEELTNQYKSWSKIFMERLFQKTVLTKDHMIARSRGGSDELHNTMALHKECNTKKDKKEFKKWFNEDPKTEIYTENYLRKINELSAAGKVENCEDYAAEISENIEQLTGKSKLKKNLQKNNPA